MASRAPTQPEQRQRVDSFERPAHGPAMEEPVNAAERGLGLMRPLDVRELPEVGLRYRETLAGPELDDVLADGLSRGPVAFTLLGSVRADIEVVPTRAGEPPTVQLSGALQAQFRSTCVRCLEAVDIEIDARVEGTLVPSIEAPGEPPDGPRPARGTGPSPVQRTGPGPRAPARADADVPEASVSAPEQLDEGTYDGRWIPLPELLRQSLLVDLPSDPTCADAGPCDERTRALIEAANADALASEREVDPRWGVLRELRASLTEKSADKDPTGKR